MQINANLGERAAVRSDESTWLPSHPARVERLTLDAARRAVARKPDSLGHSGQARPGGANRAREGSRG